MLFAPLLAPRRWVNLIDVGVRLRSEFRVFLLLFSLVTACLLFAASSAHAQAAPAYIQPWQLSAFGGINGTYTGLSGGKNLGITAGADLRFYSFRRYMVSAEVRGTYPFHDGAIDSQKNALGGFKVDRTFFGRVHPYADILAGRGLIDYQGNGYLNAPQTLIYTSSPSTVISPGVGVDLDFNDQLAFKLDAQFQHWDTPVTASGSLDAKALTAGIVYRFDFNHHPRYPRQ
jgi:hypothetical protein